MKESDREYLNNLKLSREHFEHNLFDNDDGEWNEYKTLKLTVYYLMLEIDSLKEKLKEKDVFMKRIDAILELKNNSSHKDKT